jgi:hypothetical protein
MVISFYREGRNTCLICYELPSNSKITVSARECRVLGG